MPNDMGRTPLHLAVQHQHFSASAVLLRAGAPIDVFDMVRIILLPRW